MKIKLLVPFFLIIITFCAAQQTKTKNPKVQVTTESPGGNDSIPIAEGEVDYPDSNGSFNQGGDLEIIGTGGEVGNCEFSYYYFNSKKDLINYCTYELTTDDYKKIGYPFLALALLLFTMYLLNK